MCDNIKIDIRLEQRYLRQSLELALATVPGGCLKEYERKQPLVAGYVIHRKYGMILFWHKQKPKIELRTSEDNEFSNMTYEEVDFKEMPPIDVIDFVESWLKKANPRDFEIIDQWEEDADHDGSNDVGFRMYNETWGHVGGSGYAFIAIKPVWVWFGK